MSLPNFLEDLFGHGRTRVTPPQAVSEPELRAAGALLTEFDSQYRLNLPAEPPPLDVEAALWAAVQYHRACQFAVFRDFGPDFGFVSAATHIASLNSPEAHYSVDLTFRFLPDLVRFTRFAPDDPLLPVLLGWAQQWPLSSVGVKELSEVEIATLRGSGSLMQMYADRAIARGDVRPMSDAHTATVIRRSLGVYDDLAPDLMRRLVLKAADPVQETTEDHE